VERPDINSYVGSIASHSDLQNNAEQADERRNRFRIGNDYFYRAVANWANQIACRAKYYPLIPKEVSGSGHLITGSQRELRFGEHRRWRTLSHVPPQNGAPRRLANVPQRETSKF
jgi:hypothetical protein